MLKSLGVVRRIDHLGRIVLPVEVRRLLGVEGGDPVHIDVDGEALVVSKNGCATCVFCGTTEDLGSFTGKPVCRLCASQVGPAVVR